MEFLDNLIKSISDVVLVCLILVLVAGALYYLFKLNEYYQNTRNWFFKYVLVQLPILLVWLFIARNIPEDMYTTSVMLYRLLAVGYSISATAWLSRRL